MVFRWEFDGIKVGNIFTKGGHLVVFMWAFGAIQVGIWWYTGGENVGPIFGNGQPQWAPTKISPWPLLPPMSKTQHGPSWISPLRPNVAVQLGPT